jgi:hypothetical protein
LITAYLARSLRARDTLWQTVMLAVTVWGLDTGTSTYTVRQLHADGLSPFVLETVTLPFVRASGGQAPLVPLPVANVTLCCSLRSAL